VSTPAETPAKPTPEQLLREFEDRAAAELTAADALAPGSDAVAWRGALLARVAVVKGMPGPAEASGGTALSGADGEAVTKALVALGYDADEVFFTLSRPEIGLEPAPRAERLRIHMEAVDPELILGLDAEAAADLAEAFGIAAPRFGTATRVLGRRVVVVDGLERSLGDERLKRRVWHQLKAATAEGPVY
jgi:hypothetical protein